MRNRKCLLIAGSPKKGNSHSLAAYFAGLLTQRGFECETLQANKTPYEELLQKFIAADLTTFSFPLYVDSLPGPLIALLERLAADLPSANNWNADNKSTMAIVNCGFPESRQGQVALGIMEQFAGAIGVKWAGGLSMGAAGALGGRSVEDAGAMLRNVTAGLSLAADRVSKDEPICEEAITLVGKPLFPGLMYRIAGNWRFLQTAKKDKVNIRAQPYKWKSHR